MNEHFSFLVIENKERKWREWKKVQRWRKRDKSYY